ncbi:MAG: hypothetical protein ACFFCW_23440, partial [Candidatus Hodarchaeota archaeon]
MLSSFDILLVAVTIFIMVLGFVGRYRRWKQGKGDDGVGKKRGKGAIRLLRYLLFHHKILRDRYKGIFH